MNPKRALRKLQILDFSDTPKANWFQGGEISRTLNEAATTTEAYKILTPYYRKCWSLFFKIPDLIKVTQKLHEAINQRARTASSKAISMPKSDADEPRNEPKDEEKPDLVTYDENNQLILTYWFKKLLPQYTYKSILAMIEIHAEAAFQAICTEDGELREDLIQFLKKPPFDEKDLNRAINTFGLPVVRHKLMSGASLYFSKNAQLNQNQLGDEQSSLATAVLCKIINTINETFIPSFLLRRFQLIERTHALKISALERDCSRYHDHLEKILTSELKNVLKKAGKAFIYLPSGTDTLGKQLNYLIANKKKISQHISLDKLILRQKKLQTLNKLIAFLSDTNLETDYKKLEEFHRYFINKETQAVFNQDNDGAGRKFLKAVAYILATIATLGYYAYLNQKERGSFQFWKSPEQILFMKEQKIMPDCIRNRFTNH